MTVDRSMDDPFRGAGGQPGKRLIARLGRGTLGWHLALSLAGLSTPLWVFGFIDFAPALLVLPIVTFPAGLLGLGRTIHACFVPHVVELDAEGLRFAWGSRIFAVPWLERHDRELPWSSLRGVQTHTFSVNGLATTKLVVTTDDGTFEVPDDRFDQSAQGIQRAILDAVQRMREPAVGESNAYVQRCRERFATPERRALSPRGSVGATAFFLPFMGFCAWMAVMSGGGKAWFFAAPFIALFGALIVMVWRHFLAHRVLVLSADGLAVGASVSSAKLIRWDEIHTVRRERTNGKTDAVDILTHDGTHTTLRNGYGRTLDQLAALIDPGG